MNMKTIAATFLAAVMLTSVLGACSTNSANSASSASAPPSSQQSSAGTATPSEPAVEADNLYAGLDAFYEGIEPVAEPTTIRYGDGVGFQLSVPIYIAWKSGALQERGVDLQWFPSAGGPLRVEALAADEIDLFGSGIGGIAVGCAQGTAMMLTYINDDSVIQKFYVAGDDPLASAAANGQGFIGSADEWKGREVYMQAGSTLQYLMGHALGNLGLTLQDVTAVYMDATNTNTAMMAGKGETWGVWNFQCYDQTLVDEGYVAVIEGYDAGIRLATAYGTSERAWADPQKNAAIKKILELHYATLEWMKASDENMQLAAQILTEWGATEGTAVPYEENLAYLQETHYYSLEENFDFFSEKVTNDNGEMYKALDMLMGIMDFYVEQGNYQETDRAFMIENQDRLFVSEGLDYVKSARG